MGYLPTSLVLFNILLLLNEVSNTALLMKGLAMRGPIVAPTAKKKCKACIQGSDLTPHISRHKTFPPGGSEISGNKIECSKCNIYRKLYYIYLYPKLQYYSQ